jgi:alkylhydroperoxidase family enzyme
VSYLERLEWGEGDPKIQRIFEHFYAERGNVPNLFRVMGLRPDLLTTFNAHFGAVMREDTLPVGLKELLAVRVSAINECDY